MGKCLSNNAVPTDYGELPAAAPANTEKVLPITSNNTPSNATYAKSDGAIQSEKTKPKNSMNGMHASSSTGSIAVQYRKMSTDSERDTDLEHDGIHLQFDEQNIIIDENIIIEDLVKIYDEKQEEYQHYGLLLNQKQCKLYLVNPHYFQTWKELQKLSKMNDILTKDRHDNKVLCSTMKFGQKDAEEMISNLFSNQLENINAGDAINFIMRKNKYEIEKEILLNKQWDINLSTLLKIDSDLFDKYVNHIVITRYEQKHIRSIFAFFRCNGYVIKYHCMDTEDDHSGALHIILMDDMLLKDIQTLNENLCKCVSNEFEPKLNNEIRIHISPYYDPISSSSDANEDIKVLDLRCMFVSVEPFSEFNKHEIDGYIYGFRLNAKSNQNHLMCLLDNNNKRFEFITNLDYVLNNNEFIKRKYSSKLRNKRSNMVNLDKRLFGQTNTCNDTSCTYIERLVAINSLYTTNKDDIVNIMINRNIDILSIYDSYIHCVMKANKIHKNYNCSCNCSMSACIHYIRFNEDKHSKENRTKYYNEQVIMNCDIIYILDQIHCFLCHNDTNTSIKTASKSSRVSTRRRKNSEKFIRDWNDHQDEKQSKQIYFGGQWRDYWSSHNVTRYDSTESIFIDDDYDHEVDGSDAEVFPKWDTLKQEFTQNTIYPMDENVYNDVYKTSICLLSTRYCHKYMKALFEPTVNEKMGIRPGADITVNHIMSIIVYCNYFNVCSKWIQHMRMNTSNEHHECEFAHFYRYLSELCQLFGKEMTDNEYLYIISFDKILFTEWKQMIHFPISVTPPLDINQSFMKELRQYYNNSEDGDDDDAKHDSNKHILKLASCDLNGIKTKYFDVRWLTDSFNEDERFIMMSRFKIYDILLDQRRSCLKDIYAIHLFQRIMNGSFSRCVLSLNQMETQKKLFALIQNHIYSNTKQKALEKLPSFKYIQDIFDNLVHAAITNKINNRCMIWLNKSELSKLKCKQLALTIYNVKQNEPGTLLKHHKIHKQQIKFVKEYEFKIDENTLKSFMESNEVITSEDHEYVLDPLDSESDEKISLYFELNKKQSECFLWCNLILLPSNMDKVLIECNAYCDDLSHEVQFESVWASKDNDKENVGGLVFDQNQTKNINGLESLTFVISLKVLQTNAVRSPTKSILSRFPLTK